MKTWKKILLAAALAAAAFHIGREAYSSAVYVKPCTPEEREEFLSQPVKRVENFAFDPSSPLESRIGPPPDFMLEWLKKYDDRTDYAGYTPTPAQRAMIAGWFRLLPGKMVSVLRERLVGVFLVDNFLGNGLSDLTVGADGRKYAWLALNTSGFGKSLSATLTGREASAFKGDGITVDCGAKGEPPGIFYPFVHELTHAYDYTAGITPYVEREWYDILNGGPTKKKRRWEIWAAYEKPLPEHDFPLRSRASFYGIGGGPFLDASEAPRVYEGLSRSPFVSLYGTQNWAEEAAELMVYKAVTDKLGRSCRVRYPGGEFTPGPAARARAEALYGRLSR